MPKYIDIKEFREAGFLQEANRRFFHPRGLALEVVVEDDGTERLGGMWDYREDPEGMLFGQDMIDIKKAKYVEDLAKSKISERRKQNCDANGIQRLTHTNGSFVDVLGGDEYLSLRQKDGWYTYTHESRAEKGELVAVLPFILDMRGNVDKLLGRYEECPAHDDGVALCAITGGVDHGSNPVEAVLQELWEEGGFRADADDLIELGTIRPLASSDACVHLYAIDVTNEEHLRREDSIGDGTKGEEGAYCDWVTMEDAVNCKSANMLSMICRLAVQLGWGFKT
jgi:8-oxo-dGTP pyrophosphatase MutT (NUDIX family)